MGDIGCGLSVARVLANMSLCNITNFLPLTLTSLSSTEDTDTCESRSGHRKRNCIESEESNEDESRQIK